MRRRRTMLKAAVKIHCYVLLQTRRTSRSYLLATVLRLSIRGLPDRTTVLTLRNGLSTTRGPNTMHHSISSAARYV